MTQAAFLERKRISPGAIAMVALLHGAGITALVLAKEPGFIRQRLHPITMVNVDEDKPPPEKPKPQPPQPPQQKEVLTWVPPIVKTPPQDPRPLDPTPYQPPRLDPLPGPKAADPPLPPTPLPPPPPPAPKLEPARARANLGSYVSDADYPSEAIRREEQGTTRFRLTVSPDGRVAGCTVTASSGSAALDNATCRLMRSRARFTPAHDTSGNAVADVVTNAITWRLPAG